MKEGAAIIVISGSRGWTDKEKIRQRILHYAPAIVYEGGAYGADRLAREVCEEEGIEWKTVNAKWERYGRGAGHLRNAEMLIFKPNLVLVFWDGKSPGTKDMIELARAGNFKMEVNY